jgi:hypothetical protein
MKKPFVAKPVWRTFVVEDEFCQTWMCLGRENGLLDALHQQLFANAKCS